MRIKTGFMKLIKYIVKATRASNGDVVFLRAGTSSTSIGITLVANSAEVFSDPDDALSWLDRIYKNACKTCVPESIKIVKLIVEVCDINDDPEWERKLRLNAVSKLTYQEAQALGIEKYAVEKKLNG